MTNWLTEKKIKGYVWHGEAKTYRDGKVPGFFISINKTCKSYKLQADLWQGAIGRRKLVRTVRHTIGTTETHSLSDARNIASECLSKIKRGVDPFPQKNKNRGTLPSVNGDPVGWTVDELMLGYAEVLEAKEMAERSISNVHNIHSRYLKRWRGRMAIEITKRDARDLHEYISTNHGKTAANQALRYFRAAYNVADTLSDDNEAFEYNPVRGVIFHKDRLSNRVLAPEELFEWSKKLEAIRNPLRREMHLLSLLSGLRPGSAMSIQQDWFDLEGSAIRFPRMKSSRAFDLPLSIQMIECVGRAQQISHSLYPNSNWLFPTRTTDGKVTHTKVVREKNMPRETGHILRHTHRTMAQHELINPINGKLLLDHKVPGIDGVYIHNKGLFIPLLKDQQTISDAMFRFMSDKKSCVPVNINFQIAAE